MQFFESKMPLRPSPFVLKNSRKPFKTFNYRAVMLVCRFRRHPKETEATQVSLGSLGLAQTISDGPAARFWYKGRSANLGKLADLNMPFSTATGRELRSSPEM